MSQSVLQVGVAATYPFRGKSTCTREGALWEHGEHIKHEGRERDGPGKETGR